MFAIVRGHGPLATPLTRDTIYTLKLRRRGIDIDKPARHNHLAEIPIADAMGTSPKPLSPQAPLDAIIARLAAERVDTLPVIDRSGVLLGVVTASDTERALGDDRDGLSAGTLARAAPELRADETLDDAMLALAASDEHGLPVLATDGKQVVGWLTHQELLRAYRERVS